MRRAKPDCRRWPTTPGCACRRSAAPGRAVGALCRRTEVGHRQQRETDRRAANVPRPARTLLCVIVLVRSADDPQPLIADGEWHGEIIDTRAAPAASATTRISSCRRWNRRPPNSTPNSRTPCRTGRRPCATCCRACRGSWTGADEPGHSAGAGPVGAGAGRRCASAAIHRHRRRFRSTSTFRGACANAPTATSTRTRCATAYPEDGLHRCADRRSRAFAARHLGPAHAQHLLRRRHAQPDDARGARPPADCGARPRCR
jgi:hypothetical protein